jgi:hypothetical protein
MVADQRFDPPTKEEHIDANTRVVARVRGIDRGLTQNVAAIETFPFGAAKAARRPASIFETINPPGRRGGRRRPDTDSNIENSGTPVNLAAWM